MHPTPPCLRIREYIGWLRIQVGVTHVSRQNISPTDSLPADISDADLMAAMAAGNSSAMSLLYDRYSRPVYSFAYRMVGDRDHAEDVMQEVFLRAWRRSARFSDTRGSLISWLLSITHNMAIDELRKRQRRPQKAESSEPDLMLEVLQDNEVPVEDQAVSTEYNRMVREILHEIPDNQREVLELGYFRGMTQREIAEYLNTPLGTIKTRMRLALRKLQDSDDIQALVHYDKH